MCLISTAHDMKQPPEPLVRLSLFANNDLPSNLKFMTHIHIENIESFMNTSDILDINKIKVKQSFQNSSRNCGNHNFKTLRSGRFLYEMDKEYKCEPYLLLHDYKLRQQK